MSSGPQQEKVPAKVNHRKLTTEKRKIAGVLPITEFSRLTESVLEAKDDVEVSLSFRKGRRKLGLVVGKAETKVGLECQNCLQSVTYALSAEYRHLLVNDDAALFDLEENEEGIVCPDEMVRVADLLEDELLLSLPMVAKHESDNCRPIDDPLSDYQSEAIETGETYKPFAGLAQLTKELKEEN